MNPLKSHLSLYFIFGFLYFLSTVMDWLLLSYIAKPLFIGAIFFYYIEERKTPVNYYNCTVLFFLFLSGIINLLEGYDYFVYILFFNFLAYCILFFQLIKHLAERRHHKIEKEHSLQLILTLIFLSCLLYISSFIVFDRSFELYKAILVYGVVVASFALCATFLYLSESTQKNMFLLFYAIDIIICELFYIIYHYYYSFPLLRFSSVFCYILSFYFLANYFLKENNLQTKE
ncbi:hypothetical protein FLJC2902T_19940 [Flavobacterium limnosediminis JC2902]|uniref:YhhN-like protein n=1 Tax=Flavobacterium limnosediminis JC2902 TaxID=1341181 RepID=V6SL23_9FLAO|nr:hypothetical protein [Flavobacterium limnosediminis]ESU27291.1 hypothetical protein FLJC2902T_19940 [Flavobacterium limnosediminis JC2902]